MDPKVLSTGIPCSNSPESYVRPESDRPPPSEVSACDVFPVIDFGLEKRSQVVKPIADTNFNVNEENDQNWGGYIGIGLSTSSNPPDFNQGSSEANAENKFSASDYKSSLDGKDLEKISKRFDKKGGIVLRLPDDGERPYLYNKGDIALYVAYLRTGMTLPFQPIIVKILDRLGLAPSQLAPNAWRIVISCSKLWRDCFNDEISEKEFLYCYKLAELPKSSGQWYFVARDRDTKLFTELPKSNGSWTREYFLVRGEAFCESVKRLWSDPNDSARERPKLDKFHLDRIQKARVFKEGVSFHYPKLAGRRREEQSEEMNTNIQSQKKAKLQETSAHRVTPPAVEEALTAVEPPRPSKGKEVATLPTTHTDAALEMVRSKQAFMEKNVTDMLTMMRVLSNAVVGLQKVLADIAVGYNLSEMENKELTMKDVIELKRILDDTAVREPFGDGE